MEDHSTYEDGLKYRPDYAWPDEGSTRDCPKCSEEMELIENLENYYGKPWWCSECQWQFSEEEFKDNTIQKNADK